MSNVCFIVGNGLSMALSKEFSLKKITETFINGSPAEDTDFLQQIARCSGSELSFDDFEANFAAIEVALDSVIKYQRFIETSVGNIFLSQYKLINPKLNEHAVIIQRIYNRYITQILTLIHGNVHLDAMERQLSGFMNFLIEKSNKATKTYFFTLNYDLLVETIFLQKIGSDKFSDFYFPSSNLKGTGLKKFDFNPQTNLEFFGDSVRKIELHHLHGSLSSFYDYDRNRVIKFKSEDIESFDLYQKVMGNDFPLIPSIITGGGKSSKIMQYPFDYHYRTLKDLCDSGNINELYVIGYSFRDEHINDLIIRWTKNVDSYSAGLQIVDFKSEDKDKTEFIKFAQSKISKRPKLPESCFEFGGVNAIHSCLGTSRKGK